MTSRSAPNKPWTPQGWQSLPAAQQPTYPDPSALESVLARLRRLPPLVVPEEVEVGSSVATSSAKTTRALP